MPLSRTSRRHAYATPTTTHGTHTAYDTTTAAPPTRSGSLISRLTHGSTRRRGPGYTSASTTAPASTRTRGYGRRSKHAGPAPVAAHRRPTMGDKIHGMAKKLAGTLTMNRRKRAEGAAMEEGRSTVRTKRRHRRYGGMI